MSSLLRILSPYNQNGGGGNQFSVQSPSHKAALSNAAKAASPLSPFHAGVFLPRSSRKGASSFKRSVFRCLMFFSLGFLLGMAPFGEVEVLKGRDFTFEESYVVRKVENSAAEESVRDLVRNVEDDNILMDRVELGVVDAKDVRERFDFVPRKQLIVVTPTSSRAVQSLYLDRLEQVLRLVPPPLLWIVVEANVASLETADVLRRSGVMYRHLVSIKNSTDVKDKRTVHLINRALEHIEDHKLDGIVYFADDDSVHSLELFESMREISRFGTWPVGMLAANSSNVMLGGPVCNGSQVIGWHTNEKSVGIRRFHIEMSGFAFNSTILWDPKRWQRPTSDRIRLLDSMNKGSPDSTFMEQVVEDESQMEGIPPSCSRIMNWRLDSEAQELSSHKPLLLQNADLVSLDS